MDVQYRDLYPQRRTRRCRKLSGHYSNGERFRNSNVAASEPSVRFRRRIGHREHHRFHGHQHQPADLVGEPESSELWDQRIAGHQPADRPGDHHRRRQCGLDGDFRPFQHYGEPRFWSRHRHVPDFCQFRIRWYRYGHCGRRDRFAANHNGERCQRHAHTAIR